MKTMLGIGIFTRPPDPGATKTRLIPALGAEGAALLHTHMLERTLSVVAQTGASTTLWVTDNPAHPCFAGLAQRYACEVRVQQGLDLGERMRSALAHMLLAHSRAIVVGSDCLVHTTESLESASERLAASDMVFTPAEDGGYVLVGACRDCPQAFEGIEWGTEHVMALTRQGLAAARITWAEQPVLWDIDLPADVLRARQAGLLLPNV